MIANKKEEESVVDLSPYLYVLYLPMRVLQFVAQE